MVLSVHFAQSVPGHMSINLGRADIRVTKQLLNNSQVSAVLQQMSRKTMSQHMRRDVPLNPGPADPLLYAQPHRHCGEWRPAFGQEQISRRTASNQVRPATLQVVLDSQDRFASQRHDAFFVPFANHINESGFKMQLFQTNTSEFRQP